MNDYENFEKGMINMNILRKGGEETKSMPHVPVNDCTVIDPSTIRS
jgi:hypothetical protein